MKSRIIIILFTVLFSSFSFGQYQEYINMVTPYLNDTIQNGYFYFKTPNNFQPGSLYQIYKQNAPDSENDMVLVDSHVDSVTNYTHHEYQQTYMNIPVEGAGCIEHYNPSGSLSYLNAKVADSINKNHVPKLTKEKALSNLLDQIRNEETIFVWEDEAWEKQIKLDRDDANATWYPTPELIWAVDTVKDMRLIISGSRYSLAYKIAIIITQPQSESYIYFVDAHNGNILKKHTTHRNDGPAYVNVYGTRTIDTRYSGGIFNPNAYILRTNDNLRGIHTKRDFTGNKAWWLLSETEDDDDQWSYSDIHETSAHYFASKSWDYFFQNHFRFGIDKSGSEIRIRTQLAAQRAYYNDGVFPRELVFGHNSAFKGWSLEPSVVAHEFTHGVTDYAAGLAYENESGALDESFSDIFGIVIQAKMLDGGFTDWIIGNNVLSSNEERRSLELPKDFGSHYDNGVWASGQPDTYDGEFWCGNCPNNSLGDYGGVHVNSGVQNKWFYILTNGENDVNDNNDFYNVQGIGMDKAAMIAYYALDNDLGYASEYIDSRQATITAAKNIFGECSIEHQSTENAWFAVGVGQENDCSYTLSNDNIVALGEQVVIYPNPAKNILNIQVPAKIDKDIRIFDATGKVVDSFSNNNLVFSRDLNHLGSGVYIISLAVNGYPIQKRFIIQK